MASPMSRSAPCPDTALPLPSRALPTTGDHRRARRRREGGQLSVEALDLAVAVRDALLLVPVGLPDGVVDIDERDPVRVGCPGQHRCTTAASPATVRAATASSCRTCPNV